MTMQKQIEAYRCNILIYKDINSIYDDKNVFAKISTKFIFFFYDGKIVLQCVFSIYVVIKISQ